MFCLKYLIKKEPKIIIKVSLRLHRTNISSILLWSQNWSQSEHSVVVSYISIIGVFVNMFEWDYSEFQFPYGNQLFPLPFFFIFSKLKSDKEEGQDQTWIELQVHY
jgi:hypothetical protein